MNFWTKNRKVPTMAIPLLNKATDLVSMSSLIALSFKLSHFVPGASNYILILVLLGAGYILFFGTQDENMKCILKILISLIGLFVGGIIML